MKRLRIVYDFEAFSDQSRGGITRYFLELIPLLAREADVEVHAGWHRSLALRELSPPGLRGRYFPPWPKTGELRRRLNAAALRRELARRPPDLVHRTYYRHAADYGTRVPQVMTLFDLIFFRFPEQFPGAAELQSRVCRAATLADRLICISEHTALDACRDLAVDAARLTVIPLGVRSLPTPVDAAPAARSFVLFVGQRAGYKNFGVVLEALAGADELRDVTLIAFGGGRWTSGERERLQRLGLGARVSQVEGDDRELARHYARASVLVYPSRYEGFGLPPLEAMQHGCAVISSDQASLPEVCGEAAEYFSPDDVTALRGALGRVLLDPAHRARLQALGRAQAARFSWDRCAESTLRLYRGLVARA